MDVISLGAGVQSTTLLLMAVRGRVMDWLDTAGRWLIIGLGLSGGLALLGYAWWKVIEFVLIVFDANRKVIDYVRNRHEFRSWKQDRKEWSQEKRRLLQRVLELEKARGGHEKE